MEENESILAEFENRQTLNQFWRFVIVGSINALLDFTVLNILSKLTGISVTDNRIIYLNLISFSIATTNSFFLNKYWSFADTDTHRSRQFTYFLGVSLIGALI